MCWRRRRRGNDEEQTVLTVQVQRTSLEVVGGIVDQSGRSADSLPEALMPDPRRTYEIGVLSQRSQCQFRLFVRNESATLANDFADTIKKERRAFHHAATQHDHVRYE